MKRYKLLKDTPTIKAGTIFEERVSDFDELKELVRITPVGAKTSPQWTVQDINNFSDWFEEIKEFEEWKPKNGHLYQMLNDEGLIVTPRYNPKDEADLHRLSIGNCYPLNTPDELIIKEQKLIPQAMHRLKMAAKKAWFEFNGSDGPDWDDLRQCQFEIHLDRRTDELYIMKIEYTQSNILPPFPTQKSCQAYIDNNLGDLKLLFGVE